MTDWRDEVYRNNAFQLLRRFDTEFIAGFHARAQQHKVDDTLVIEGVKGRLHLFMIID